ncbi:hypothetical protein G9A89_003763 [Geosiphon pyriformis]|nr:hypothetical protein G9A89_003763 [Geosiphon pyriformis]
MLVSDFVKSGGLVKDPPSTFEHSSIQNVSDMNSIDVIYSNLRNASLSDILIYTNSSVKNFGTFSAAGGAATYFSDLGLHVGVEVHGLLLSILAEMQAVALALKYVSAFSKVTVFSDSQTFLDAC